jgi:glycosyltransferase involved in cell wall biosynthesis
MIERFYIDLSYLLSSTTGVAVYATRMAQHLQDRFHCEILAPPQFRTAFRQAVKVPEPWHYHNAVLARAPLGRLAKGVRLGRRVFVYAPHMRPLLSTANQAVTVHDLIHHHYPTRNVAENAFNYLLLPGLLRHLNAILTVSQSSKLALCERYRLAPERVKVVPNGIDLAEWRPSGRPPASEPAYLLVVSANRPYKNTVELLEHHQLWANRFRLVIVSTRGRYGGVVRDSIRRLRLEQVVDLRDDLTEHELIRLYQDCTATVYPSLMEGFGRPALEAMAVGRPVILSDIPVHRENFGRAAIFVSPGNPQSWARAFATLADRQRLQEASRLGRQVARGLTWEHSGNQLVDALLEVEPGLAALRLPEDDQLGRESDSAWKEG